MGDTTPDGKTACGCFCHKVSGIFVALIGVTFLLGAFDVLTAKIVGYTWPSLLILLGLKNSIGKGGCKCCANS